MIAAPSAPVHVPVSVAQVPFYSQFQDIQAINWQKRGCGIASLAMVINFYKPDTVSVDTLLKQGIASGAYDQNAGWKHKGLVLLSKRYGLNGTTHDLSSSGMETAFAQLKTYLKEGPVIVSVHYKFDPKSTIPHLVVIDGISEDSIYYNDPASKAGEKQISTTVFLKAWKKKFIVIRPVETSVAANTATAVTSAKKVSVTNLLTSWISRFTA